MSNITCLHHSQLQEEFLKGFNNMRNFIYAQPRDELFIAGALKIK